MVAGPEAFQETAVTGETGAMTDDHTWENSGRDMNSKDLSVTTSQSESPKVGQLGRVVFASGVGAEVSRL